MKSKQVRVVVYSGKVGAKMAPAKHRMPSNATPKHKVLCQGGPMHGVTLWLTDSITAFFTYRGETGRYNFGKWEAV